MPRLQVHLLHEPAESVRKVLEERLAPEIDLAIGDVVPPGSPCEILVGGRVHETHLHACPKLRALIIPWSGLQARVRDLMRSRPDVSVHNLHHNARPVAELAMALLLAAAKFVVPMDRRLREGDWTPRYEPNPSLFLDGRHAVVLGYGAVGRRVAELCRGFGMRVSGVRRRPELSARDGPEAVHGIETLPDLLPRADVLVVSLPLTAKTEGLIGAEELGRMPAGSVLVNVGRGPIVDETALYDALRRGPLRAAGLDVWYRYPLDAEERTATPPASHPFHELDNVVLSPHRGGSLGNEESERMRMEALAVLLNAASRGEAIPNRVDLDEGY